MNGSSRRWLFINDTLEPELVAILDDHKGIKTRIPFHVLFHMLVDLGESPARYITSLTTLVIDEVGAKLRAHRNVAVSHFLQTYFANLGLITRDLSYNLKLTLCIDVKVSLHVLNYWIQELWSLQFHDQLEGESLEQV